jgi:hypothetical protein
MPAITFIGFKPLLAGIQEFRFEAEQDGSFRRYRCEHVGLGANELDDEDGEEIGRS